MSRFTYVLAFNFLIMAIFMNKMPRFRAFLSNTNMLALQKGVVCSSMLQILMISMLVNNHYRPVGTSIDFAICIVLGTGYIFCTVIAFMVYLPLVEFPLSRIIHYTVQKYVSHDRPLA